MEIRYRSTRSNGETVSASEAILRGLAPDGGLYVPDRIPAFSKPLAELCTYDYKKLAYEVMKDYLSDFTEDELMQCINGAYDSKFDTDLFAPLVKQDDAYYLELFHGPTIAFKDMALTILPHFMTMAAKKSGSQDEVVILTATSGDTGKAAMAGFADVPGIRIIVFYPDGGVSKIQELQMITEPGKNTAAVAIDGNFDDAQTAVKQIFHDPKIRKTLADNGFRFSSANSINIGRLVPQIVYYVYAYAQLVEKGEITCGDKINICVPTGNFGNILAAYYASLMGLPVNRLLCASNENKVLFDFFATGEYDRKRPFILTSSPSMDILISSNLERLIFRLCGNDAEKNCAFMKALSENGTYEISGEMKDALSAFYGGFATEEENFAGIRALYEKTGYVIDTHTGIGNAVYRSYRKASGDTTPTVIASTASPYKFAKNVVCAIDPAYKGEDDFSYIEKLHEISGIPVPKAVSELKNAPILHRYKTSPGEMADLIQKILGIM